MTRVIYKLFWTWDFEKEEKWLNDMAAKGLTLTDTGNLCRYTFEEGTPGEYQYRLELLDQLPEHPESRQYIAFMEETGAQQISSCLRWVYFRKKAEAEPFDLFSDMDSRIRHLQRITSLLLPVMIAEYLIGLSNLMNGFLLHSTVNLGISIPCIALGALISVGFVRLSRRIRKMKQEREIHE